MSTEQFVIPAQAGTPFGNWVPAFAGTTDSYGISCPPVAP